MRARLTLALLAAVFAIACEREAPPPPPMGLAGAPGAAGGASGAGANPGMPPVAVPAQNPHAAPANPHAAPEHPSAPGGEHPKASPFPDSAPVVVRGDKPAGELTAPAKGVVTGTVEETMNAAGYTYLRVKSASGADVWAAVTEAKVAVGTQVSITESLTMTDFHSKALNRTFPSIVFGTLN